LEGNRQRTLEDLDKRWGSWRHGAEFKFYSRRKVIIAEIKRLVDSLEAQRVGTKASLSQVINGLKAAAKAREGGN
jgi:transcriptional activator of glycolytic enzymes GCR1